MKSKIAALLLALSVLAFTSLAKQDLPLTDNVIADQVKIKLAGDSYVKGGALEVDVKNGVATLSGAVETTKQKERAEKLTKGVKGVKQVVNRITLRK